MPRRIVPPRIQMPRKSEHIYTILRNLLSNAGDALDACWSGKTVRVVADLVRKV